MSDMHPQGEQASTSSGHEGNDLKLRPIVGFGLGLIALAVVVHFALGFFMKRFEADSKSLEALRPPLYGKDPFKPPPPNTPENPRLELLAHRERERKILDTYGWEREDGTVVRVPIDRAIEILAERGLPKVKNVAPKGARGSEKP